MSDKPRRRTTHSLYANEGGGIRTWQEVLPGDPDFDETLNHHSKLRSAVFNVLDMQSQHGGPYPQYPELHKAIEELRKVYGDKQ